MFRFVSKQYRPGFNAPLGWNYYYFLLGDVSESLLATNVMAKGGNLSIDEYKRELNRVHSARKKGTLRKGNPKVKMGKQAVPEIQTRFPCCSDVFFSGPFKIEIEIFGKIRADIDNIGKGILDALNGIAYKDDRQCVSSHVRLYPY